MSDDMEKLLQEAAKRGAKQALHELGLDDDQAGPDVRDLRTLITDFRAIRKSVMNALVTGITLGFLALLVGGATMKFVLSK